VGATHGATLQRLPPRYRRRTGIRDNVFCPRVEFSNHCLLHSNKESFRHGKGVAWHAKSLSKKLEDDGNVV
jgi:hypothetical protein